MRAIRKIGRLVILFFRRIEQIFRWEKQYRTQLKKNTARLEFMNLSELSLGNVLILAPHADDELIGCSSILLNKDIQSNVLYFQLYGYDGTEENRNIRDNEIKSLSNRIGFNLYIVDNVATWLEEHLKKSEYDAVLFPYPYDWHWEHRFVFNQLASVLSEHSKEDLPVFLCYSVSVPITSKRNTYVSVLGQAGQKSKWDLFQENYRSQKMPVYRYKLQEKLNYKGTAAELFYRVSEEDIFSIYQRLSNDTVLVSELNTLREELNDIVAIRSRITSFM